jgi:BirA family transcriptional regulator, biotin operon repressor / biotin---[acetyl-CoA-carboxylase] ligase
MGLDPAVSAAGFRHLAHDVIGSTNAQALALARAGDPGCLWITARAQSAGRGRRERQWVSEPGNLYATLLLVDPAPTALAPQLSFVAALAVHDAASEAAGSLGPRLTLKWPNDVLCDGGKFAGILVEGEGIGRTLAVALGIGINCAHHPDRTDYPATDLASAGALVSPETLLGVLSRTMQLRLRQWDRGEGFASVRTDWIKRAAGIGQDVAVRLAGRNVTGRFAGIDAGGRLLLHGADGKVETIASGDVFPLMATEEVAPAEVAEAAPALPAAGAAAGSLRSEF